jgi:hypothetical protein
MCIFDARHEAAEVIGQWGGIVWDEGPILKIVRGDKAKAEYFLREHWKYFEPKFSDEEVKEIARWIARLTADDQHGDE